MVISDALTFMAGDRSHVEHAYPGDIIGLYNAVPFKLEILLLKVKC